jgi:hypothetical protein
MTQWLAGCALVRSSVDSAHGTAVRRGCVGSSGVAALSAELTLLCPAHSGHVAVAGIAAKTRAMSTLGPPVDLSRPLSRPDGWPQPPACTAPALTPLLRPDVWRVEENPQEAR